MIKAGHLVYISHPRAVAAVIEGAARYLAGAKSAP